jgi:DNA end-binding protein Ku
MPRSLWNGTIAFGMVRVPVKLYSATESKAVRFRERHSTDGSAIEHKRICVQEGKEVPYGETVKGFEVSSGSYITLSKEEIASADGPGAHMIEIHNKSHLVALRAIDEVIALHTMRFSDELVAPGDMDIPTPQRKPSKLEVAAAGALVDQLSSSFQPEEYEDTYRAALLELIERKARGETIDAPEAEPEAPEGDLLGALQASLEHRGGRTHPLPARSTAKKSRSRKGQSGSAKRAGTSRSSSATRGKSGKPTKSGGS